VLVWEHGKARISKKWEAENASERGTTRVLKNEKCFLLLFFFFFNTVYLVIINVLK
jgi:hypothetical protein